MGPAELHNELRLLHAQGDSATILEKVEASLPQLEELPTSPLIGSIFRYAMLARYREMEYDLGDVWWERAMHQFAASNYLKGVAVLLITPSFRSLDLIPGHRAMQSVALMVIRGVEAIAQAAGSGGEEDDVFQNDEILRIAHEKHAYCLFRVGKHQEAIDTYQKALNYVAAGTPGQTDAQLRAELKVRGGAALARYCLCDPQNHNRAKEELQDIERRSRESVYLLDLRRITGENLAKLEETDCAQADSFHHYDIR